MQRRAVEAGKGPVLIVAGPGTGKTKTLTARIAFLLGSGQATPDEIVALTFTTKAATEMRERLAKLVSTSTKLPTIATFHALGQRLLAAGGHAQPMANEQQRSEIIRALPRPAAFKGTSARDLGLMISNAKTTLHGEPADKATRQLLADYQAALRAQHLHDFDDLLVKTYQFLQANQAVRPSYKFVLVDEFQDTSELQYELLQLLANRAGKARAAPNIFAIGDPNQSIYAFRGAGAGMFTRLRADFPAVTTVELTNNYRSRPQIVAVANAVFPESPQLVAQTTSAGTAHTIQTLNEYSEAAYILNEVETGIGGSDMLKAHGGQQVREPRDYAVLYRTHHAGRALQKVFAGAGVPFQIAGEGSPYERPEIQAAVATLRFLLNTDEAAPPKLKKLSPTQVKSVLEGIEITDQKAVSELAVDIATALDLHDDYLPQFYGMLVQFGAGQSGLAAALEHIEVLTESAFYDPTVNAVALLTIHASKGLEFEHVFLIGAEEGILPKITKSAKTAAVDFAEEKRLFYVAATRAKQTLTVLHTKVRGGQPARPSRFIQDLSPQILPRALDPAMPALEKRLRKNQQKRAQTSLF